MLFGKVEDAFNIRGRGCVVAFSWVAHDVRLQIKDQIQLHAPNGNRLDTFIAGMEILCGPNRDKSKTAILLAPNITVQDVPKGTEIWLTN